eukprot:CAMPEP_0172190518 /NCGR_PEP_ID=MMETSP1050-20130122/23160_1 /TAXON_ID=233186 /ORGANISM="Cryptomonas curvata, Strain CCAP979/52" /LENGTH=375 /DNA_ID=CAMNT_0012865405 /DNA_START=13 /DNA_END=1136 /DNA_ORIENTATION=-
MSYFADVPQAPPDPLLSIDGRYKADQRAGKLNLGIGVLRRTDASAHEFATVLEAAKGVPVSTYYPHPGGDDEFVELSAELIFGCKRPANVTGVQTVGGSGALRVCAELLVSQGIENMYIPNPSWANHKPLLAGGGCKVQEYVYLDEETHTVDIEKMLAAIRAVPAKSAVLFQVAAHNPTGVDLTDAQWDRVLALMTERRSEIFPVFDSAYQGLARGLEEDVRIVRKFLAAGLEFTVCNSHSKNFGLYGERVGSLFVACQTPEIASCVATRCKLRIRTSYSVPPLHGAKIVAAILSNPDLRRRWEAELAETRDTLNAAHTALAAALGAGGLPPRFGAPRYGLFTQLFLSDEKVLALEQQHACYVAPGGRINVSSLT